MSRQYDPYENVVAVMEEAMNIGGIDKRMFEIIKIHSERLRFTFLWRWMTEVLRYLKDTESSIQISEDRSKEVYVITRTYH